MNTHPPEAKPLSDQDYERIYRLLCDYTYGIISFLELLEQLEQMLHISSSQPELVNHDGFL